MYNRRRGHTPEDKESRAIRDALYALGIKESAHQIVRDLPHWRKVLADAKASAAKEAQAAAAARPLTAAQAASRLGVSISTIYRRCQAGLLAATKTDGRWAITAAAVSI
jgi:excisionase family DNA binding protein